MSINEVPPQSLSLLINRPSKEITDEEVEQVCKILRDQRANFILDEKKPKKERADINLSIDDLEL